MAPLKVLISGAGIAGTALACSLSRLGHAVTVVERFPSLRATGLQIDLRGHGIEALKRMGLEPAFRAKSIQENGIELVDHAGTRRAFFPANRSGKGLQSFSTDYEIMRGDLCQLMYDAAKKDVAYKFGTSIRSYTEKDDAVDVLFENGETDTYDLVVGADGVRSRLRRLIFANEATDGLLSLGPIYMGYFTAARPIKEGEDYIASSYVAPGRRYIMTRRHSPDRVQIYMACRTDSQRLIKAYGKGVDEEKAALAEVFKGAGWETERFLKDLEDSDDFYCEHLALVKLKSWSRGRLALVGDAAYCPSPNTGMGTTSSIVGAYILAGEIGKHCGPDMDAEKTREGLFAALQAYEDKFRPFMEQVQRGLSEDSTMFETFPTRKFSISMMNYLLGFAAFLRLNVFGKWFLREKITNWDLPSYE